MAEFKLPDPKNVSGKVLGMALLGVLGLVTYSYILPWLNTIVWGTVQLALGVFSAGVLGYILLSKKFWKRLGIILSALGELAFGWFIEMNPFAILEAQLSQSEDDREQLRKQCEKLKAQDDKLAGQLTDENQNMSLAAKKMTLCKEKLQIAPGDEEIGYQLEAASNDYTNSKDFIDKVSPISGDIKRLVSFADKAYRKSGYALSNARNTLSKQRATYEAVTTGSNAMKKALRAFTGDTEMNKAGTLALEKLRTDIAAKVGIIKNSIQLTSQIMNEKDLNDAAKVSLAADQVEKLNIDATFDYVAQLQELPGKVPVSQGNKWLNQLKQQ